MTPMQLMQATGVGEASSEQWADPITQAFVQFSITSTRQQAAFIAQITIESAYFTRLVENLYYSDPTRLMSVWPTHFPNIGVAQECAKNPQKLANFVYCDRLGNGSYDSGDGWIYRGRGLIMLTGRGNYEAASSSAGLDLVADPDRLAEPMVAARVAGWYWTANGCGPYADAGNIDQVTRIVNGPGMEAAAERRVVYGTAMTALS
jgi:putative chitinase